MKTSIWKRFFRCGYNFSGGGYAAHYNGKMAKTDRNIKLNGNIDNVKQLLND